MKRFITAAVSGICFLALTTVVRAQDCSSMGNWDLHGTYTMSGSGFMDLSKALPGMGMPAGLVPMTWVGAHTLNGGGGGGGWVAINVAGSQMTGQFVGLKYAISPDCSIQTSYSLKIKELNGLVIGPFSRIMVPMWSGNTLTLLTITVGSPAGTPTGPGLDSGVEYRISTQF